MLRSPFRPDASRAAARRLPAGKTKPEQTPLRTGTRRGQRTGQVRADVKPDEPYAVMAAAARGLAQAWMTGAARSRSVAIVIDGLRP